MAACEEIVKHYYVKGPQVTHQENWAYYSPSKDLVNMPDQTRFDSVQSYYAVLFHELTYSTGHERRLNRPGITDQAAFASETYSKEELVAEMGAAFLCGMCDIANQTIDNTASYVQGWLKRLRSDKKLIVQAAAQAQKSTDFIMGQTWKGGDS